MTTIQTVSPDDTAENVELDDNELFCSHLLSFTVSVYLIKLDVGPYLYFFIRVRFPTCLFLTSGIQR